jgi:Flp pilus assembly protein TadG
MLDLSICRHIRAAASRFAGANQGNIAVIFAIALVPLIAFVGAAVDYTRANSARSSMQSALDSVALMLSKDLTDGLIKSTDIDAKAKTYFAALYTNKDSTVATPDIHGTYTAKDPTTGQSTIVVTGSGYVTSDFMNVAGFPRLNFNTGATSTWGNARMRVALVLDVTGSMGSDNKMPNMQSAAKSMIDTLSALNKQSGDVYISVIPFSRDVNIGNGTPAAAWVAGWSAWEDEPASIKTTKPANWANYGPGSACPFGGQAFTCVTTPVSGSPNSVDNNSKAVVPPNGTYSGYICPGVDSGTSNYYNGCYTSVDAGTTTTRTNFCTGSNCACKFSKGMIGGTGSSCSCTGNNSQTKCSETVHNYTHTWVKNNHSTWNGCVVDRDQNNDTTNLQPTLGDTSTQFYVEQYSLCPNKPLTAMSNQWATLKTTIDGLVPNGNTNQAIGAAWGWLSLTQTAPLSAPAKDTGYTYNDFVVLVSDGLNTQDRWSTDQTYIDNRQKLLCDAMKASPFNVQIFAIQINTSTTSPDPTSAVLQYCAGSKDNFQEIKSAADTASAFQNVTTQLAKLRVAH